MYNWIQKIDELLQLYNILYANMDLMHDGHADCLRKVKKYLEDLHKESSKMRVEINKKADKKDE